MKSIVCTFVVAVMALVGTAPLAEARSRHGSSHVYIGGYRSCGTPIYHQRYVIRYQHCGTPVWGYRVVAAPRSYCPPPRPRYHAPVCPPPRHYYGGHHNHGVVIEGRFRL